MSQELPFDPFPFLDDPHQQTIIGSLFNFGSEPSSKQKIVSLPDGDQISLEITTPKEWKETDLTVFFVHGLCGSHKSPYLIRMTKRLEPLGIRSVRFNMRGCGSGKGLSRRIYHSGRSEDVFYSIRDLKEAHPTSPIILVGFSLGGNIVLKLAGELGTLGHPFLHKVIAINPPVDLFSSILLLGNESNALYEKYFYRLLRTEVHFIHRKFKDLPRVQLPRHLKLYEFDQIYTAPMSGFSSAEDYYNKCSAVNYVSDIALPCNILLAEDDPIILSSALDGTYLPPNITLFKTKKGGHMGYLSHPKNGKGLYWLDSILLEWMKS